MKDTDYQQAFDYAADTLQAAVQDIPKRLAAKIENFCERIQTGKGDPLKKLHILYEFMDEIYAHVKGYTPCGKGCSHCCHYNVVVTELEVQYIQETTDIRRNRKNLTSTDIHGTPCPFLREGVCTIYPSRPFACRRRVAMTKTAQWCRPDIAADHQFPMIHFEGIDRSFDLIVLHSKRLQCADIRELF